MLSLISAFVWLLLSTKSIHATDSIRVKSGKRVPTMSVPYIDPRKGGGSMLDASAGLGEPLNVIISGLSSPEVLDAKNGLYNFAKAIGYSQECLGLHLGDPQQANLGDGQGWVNETEVIREDYGDSILGSCDESLQGGNHFRVFPQGGTNALFLVVSKEENLTEHHTIAPDGYNVGRDILVNAAVGKHSFGGVTYLTESETVHGLLPVGSEGINHGIAIDGDVALLTVTIQG